VKARFLSRLPSVRQTPFHVERCYSKDGAIKRVREDGESANDEEEEEGGGGCVYLHHHLQQQL